MTTRTANKYRARTTTTFDGQVFDSQAEARRWNELRLLQIAGDIRDLVREPVYTLAPGFTDRHTGRRYRPITYSPDFQYVDGGRSVSEGGRLVCEEIKGGKATQTTAFRIRWRLALQRFPDVEWRLVET